ncbi:uncharacterized protein K460DRAFT_369726 [Cucurbitaria berberidis CBS 394.84]|uniref:Uncharacterized protein n=1 Tax=Cucurbitaria berberidis CBS 394.84 TaxID=1168544 RepID=A0A9P4L584_9PLEO|nr:uncharacterized protein K460DRAFT_369726 [Cucurbitaria berberidis CBS 394.84]KAF1841718.1 hypothetical protein K460DRAFT_369726 [Cucurbitaria berberidis CBS 394.84]
MDGGQGLLSVPDPLAAPDSEALRAPQPELRDEQEGPLKIIIQFILLHVAQQLPVYSAFSTLSFLFFASYLLHYLQHSPVSFGRVHERHSHTILSAAQTA